MYREKTYPHLMFFTFLTFTGCTSYEISPEINNTPPVEVQEISHFTHNIESPWKNTRFGKSTYDATTLLLPKAKDVSNTTMTSSGPILEIKILERSSGGACAQDYLTGLSLGLIPSTCTRHEIYKFNFVLANNGDVCSHKKYIVNSKTFSHILALPFTAFSDHDTPLTLYQSALTDFIGHSKCAAP